MGEGFLGFPNRFRVVNNLLDMTYNPTHVLSAYQGYKLSKDYLNRNGGNDYPMLGTLVARSITPYSNLDYNIGSATMKYNNVYAQYFHGNADSATELNHAITLRLNGAVTGTATFTGKGATIDITTSSNHNHNGVYLPLSGGAITGNLKLNGINIGITNKNGYSVLAVDGNNNTYIDDTININTRRKLCTKK